MEVEEQVEEKSWSKVGQKLKKRVGFMGRRDLMRRYMTRRYSSLAIFLLFVWAVHELRWYDRLATEGTYCPPSHPVPLPTCAKIQANAAIFASDHQVTTQQLLEPFSKDDVQRRSLLHSPPLSGRKTRLSVAYLAIGDGWDKKETGCWWWWQTDCVGSDSALRTFLDALDNSNLKELLQIEVLLFHSSAKVPSIFSQFIQTNKRFSVQPVFLEREYYEAPGLRPDETCCQPWASRQYSRFYTGMNYWRLNGMFRHPRLLEAQFIWTLDLDLEFTQPLGADPVALMEESGAVIGYTQLRVEKGYSVPDDELTHWARCLSHPRALALARMDRRAFSGNNIILRTSFFRSVQYKHLMQYIDTGVPDHPIFTKRWTDQNLYWLAASLFLAPPQLKYFSKDVLPTSHMGYHRHCAGDNDSPSNGVANVWQHFTDQVEHVPACVVKPDDYI